MNKAIEARLFGVWLALSAITLLSFWLSGGHDSEHPGVSGQANAAVTYAALALVAIKVRVIVVEFMEARHASKKLQRAMDAWLFLLLAALATIYALELDMPAV